MHVVPVRRIDAKGAHEDNDALAAEEPLEIRIGPTPVAVTMRTPGHDDELAAGFLVTEGIVALADQLTGLAYCTNVPDDASLGNIITARLRDDVELDFERLRRNTYTTSSCGLCGKASIDAIRVDRPPLESDLMVPANVVSSFPGIMRKRQRNFDTTGGLHAAALFNAQAELLCIREDVGRHNAVDKVIGWSLLNGYAFLDQCILQVSGRASFEIVQKAFVAGIPIVSAVSAVSSLAVQLAEECNLTLAGFVRDGRLNVYASPQRILTS
jgi:FdhD protein